MVKVLMVHGVGVNAAIFEAQTGKSNPTQNQSQIFSQTRSFLPILSKNTMYVAKIDTKYLAPIRALLPSHWEYHFFQGPYECGPAPGICEVYPGQTYNCFFFVPSLIELQSVHDMLEEVIEDEGPFDVAWGFSAVGYFPHSKCTCVAVFTVLLRIFCSHGFTRARTGDLESSCHSLLPFPIQ